MKIHFTDKALTEIKHPKLEFNLKPFVDIPFKNLRNTRLKGLKLRVFKGSYKKPGGIYFVLQYWFKSKTNRITP